jgi:hypothetical protein
VLCIYDRRMIWIAPAVPCPLAWTLQLGM